MTKFRAALFNGLKRRRLFKDFIFLMLPVLVLGFFVIALYYRTYTKSIDFVIEQNEKQNIELQTRSILNEFRPLIQDIVYVSQVDRLLNLQGKEADLEILQRMGGIYASFLRRKQVYDQIRIIDTRGMEVLRINYNGGDLIRVSGENLQDKSSRDYFRETIELDEGMIYISHVDLNREYGKVEYPVKPVIRLAMPIYNGGRLLGIVVLNYHAQNIFNEIIIGSTFSYGKYLLVNPDNFWSYNPYEKGTWKFSLTSSEDEMNAAFPHLDLNTIRKEEGGSFYTDHGLLTFSTVRPYVSIDPSMGQSQPYEIQTGHEWKLVSFVSNEIFSREYAAGRNRVIITSVVVFLAVLFMMFIFSINRQRRMIAEEDLREEASIFSGNPAPVIKVNERKIVERANAATTELFHKNITGENIETLLPGFALAYWKFSSGEEIVQFEETLEKRTFLFTLNPDSGDKRGSVILYGTDITNRKQIELEFVKLSKAVDQSANTIVITDTDGNITFANKAFEKTTGYSIEEAIGKNPNILKSGNQPDSVYVDLWETLERGGAWHGEFLNKRKDGSTYWEEAVITPIRNNNNEIVSYLAVKEDITNRKRAEDNLKKAKEEAEIANRLKSEFLANMSHEIRTPMNAIIGFTDILIDDEKDPDRKEKLGMIKKSGRNLLNLINDILDFSKIEAGKMKIEPSVFNLARTLGHIKTMYDIVADEEGLTFTLIYGESIPNLVYGDELRLNQILLNIVSNAFKFTEKGYVEINCSYNSPLAEISVSDSGVGIEGEKMESIFSAFEQADSSAERRYGGTGLGLAISRRLARLMNGDISLHSEVGKGTTFTITVELPPADVELTAARERSGTLPGNAIQREIGEKMVENWLKQIEGDPEMEQILVDGITELPKKFGKLEDAVYRNRRGDIRFIAHELKGFAGNLNMHEIFEKVGVILLEAEKENYSIEDIRTTTEELRVLVESIPKEMTVKKRRTRNDPAKVKPDYAVLLAEDNEINQRLIKTFLKGINLSCDTAPNGRIALEQLESKPYDLLLLDMQMPVMDGEELIKRIRNHNFLNNLHVIALTAHAMKGDAEKYINLGCDDYLSKPVDRELLYEKIQSHMLKVMREGADAAPDSGSEDLLLPAVTGNRNEVIKLVGELEEHIKIFNPDRIWQAADDFIHAADDELTEIGEQIKQAAEQFDDESTRRIAARLASLLRETESG